MEVVQDTQLAQIRFSTQIIKRLGEELNPSIDQSILELVKNSYDADSKHCSIELTDITEPGGTIIIKDDGIGMDSKGIIDGWLVLGESSKSVLKRTSLGRIPAGTKGLGRLAALRMGEIAELTSIPKSSKRSRFELTVNWRHFDNAKLVNDVYLNVEHINITQATSSGTTITIKELKNKIGEREVKKIARGLILLADPFDDDPNSFKPTLKVPEFKEMQRLVSRRYFDDADYHLVAKVNASGLSEATILDYKGKELFRGTHNEIARRKDKKYDCPPTSFDLWAFILNSITFTNRQISLGEVREWLKEFGGVHLYENGLRVNPYGNAGNDWLDMNLSRARSPEERPSTNTSIGIVRVRDSRGLLSQKTDRSGFIENDVFHEIREFCQDALEWMAKRRLEIAEKKRQKEKEQTSKESTISKDKVQKSINKLAPSKRTELKGLFSKYDKARQEEVMALRMEVQLYRTLSTAGITAATFSHESRGNPLKVISQAIKAIDRRAKENFSKTYDGIFSKPIQSIIRAVNALAVLGNVTLQLLAYEKRRLTKVEIHQVITNILESFKPFFEGRDISISTSLTTGKPFLRSSEAAIESIITNLLNNSIVALENSSVRNRKISITTYVEESTLTLVVSDNGPGIQDIDLKDIWLPGQTSNHNGTGLGLTIVRDTVNDLGGNVSAIANGELGGAEIIIELPVIGK